MVRRNVGYRRYDTPEQLEVLNQLYDELRLYTNYFLPVMKLLRKERVGSKIKKVYDKPQTPYHRMLASPELSKAKKKILRQTYATLNPAQLKRNITSLQEKLVNLPAQGDKNRLKAHNVRRIDLPSRPVLRPNVRSNNQRRLA